MLINCVRCGFTTKAKHPKGSIGKEGSLGSNFSFPRHKELFNTGYYDGENDDADEAEMFESPISKKMAQENQLYNEDQVNPSENNMRKDFSVEGGIMQNYKKLAGQTVEEVLTSDFWDAKKKIGVDAAKMFDTAAMSERDMMNNTKNYTMRARLNRELDFTEDFRKAYLTKEYGNYEKYETNKVETKYDEGADNLDQDRFYENYMQLVKRLPTREAEDMTDKRRKVIDDLITDDEYSHKEFANNYHSWHVDEKHMADADNKAEEEQDFHEDPENTEREYHGRMSPFAKEQIFREYELGTSIKDLSLKYGCLQQRIKAIIFQKHLYWNEVYPKMGESHMRQAFEREAIYASEYPFVEYGVDLHIMAEYEKGVKVKTLSRTEYDTNPPREVKQHVEKYFEKSRPRKNDRIPIKFTGRSGDGYLMQDWVIHRGKGAPRVTETFREITRHYGTPTEHMIKPRIANRMRKNGIRYAVLGDKYSS